MPSKNWNLYFSFFEHEINNGNLKSYKIVGGSGMDMYYNPSCSCFILDLLEGMAIAGLLGDQIEKS